MNRYKNISIRLVVYILEEQNVSFLPEIDLFRSIICDYNNVLTFTAQVTVKFKFVIYFVPTFRNVL